MQYDIHYKMHVAETFAKKKNNAVKRIKRAYYSCSIARWTETCLIVLLGIHRGARYNKLINGTPGDSLT